MTIEIADHDPRWPALAAESISELMDALPGVFARIEHFGSTSVPGLAAKPVIDLMAGVTDLDDVTDRLHKELPALGYRYLDVGMAGRLFFPKDQEGRRTHHLHVVPLDSIPTRNEIILRDYLRRRPQDAARYGALKRAIAAELGGADSLEYTRRKTDLVQELVDAARAERGLPSVPVWEE
ncbi:MAG TPA: GrpB family protein [Actinocrinis sp.]|nr:GrpB family protein [Actinocrinis sp.]